ncbi:MAG TPA: peptidoglycan-binding domain-containing protein, partial [Chthoniobacterales bacterium]|nr:peptidoglycan-binding domain-containing protein [Chthoniobacterales bacterium]
MTNGSAEQRRGSGAKSTWTALALGCVLLITVFVTLCLVQQPSLALGKCLRLFLALGAALISYLIAGKLAVEFQGKVAAGDTTGSETKIAGSGGFAVFLLLAVFYDPLDARPFLAQIGLVKPDATVAAAQQVLHDERGYNPAVRGVADARFVKEVAELQKEKGLSITGIVDAQTLSALSHLQKGQVVIYRSKPAVLNTDGPGGSAAEDPAWMSNTALHDESGQSINS